MIKLDLGCGQNPKEGFQGIDSSKHSKAEYTFDLCWDAWPFEDDSVDELYCSHFIEHIPANFCGEKDLLFQFFDEAYRVAKPGCKFYLQWPYFQSARAFQDPTHRRFIPIETMFYLQREWRINNGLDHYNVNCNWIPEDQYALGHWSDSTRVEDSFAKLIKA